MILKLLVMMTVNLIIPTVLRNRTKPVHKFVAFLFYVLLVYPLNIIWASLWGVDDSKLLYIPGGGFFLFYWIYMLSVGYTSKRESRQLIKDEDAKKNIAAQESLELAVKLIAKGRRDESTSHFKEIVKFYPNTDASDLARQYLNEFPAETASRCEGKLQAEGDSKTFPDTRK